jgi:hypothetical protein
MVIDADKLDLTGLLYAIIGIGVGILVAGLLIAIVAGRMGGRRFGVRSIALGLVIAVALFVDVVVASRTLSGDVTGWDVLWAAVLTAGAGWCVRRLGPPAPSAPE